MESSGLELQAQQPVVTGVRIATADTPVSGVRITESSPPAGEDGEPAVAYAEAIPVPPLPGVARGYPLPTVEETLATSEEEMRYMTLTTRLEVYTDYHRRASQQIHYSHINATCCYAPPVSGVDQGKACGCCCPLRLALGAWCLGLVAMSVWNMLFSSQTVASAFGSPGLNEAKEYCARAGAVHGNASHCPVICEGCGASEQEPCDFDRIAADNRLSPLAYLAAQLVGIGVNLVGFYGAYLSCDHNVWLGARLGGAPPYPRRPEGAIVLLRIYAVLCVVPLVLTVLGSVSSFLTAADDEHLKAAWTLSLDDHERTEDATCSSMYLTHTHRVLDVSRTSLSLFAVLSAFLVSANMAATALGVARQLIQSKHSVSPGPTPAPEL